MHTSATAVAAILPVAVLSDLLYAPGDQVKAKGASNPFWMTVDSINPRTGFCRCSFGSTGRDAGNFHQRELQIHGGSLIQAAG